MPKKGGDIDVQALEVTTDSNGVAKFNNIPLAHTGRLRLFVRKDGYHPQGTFSIDPKSENRELTATLAASVSLTGRVTHEDGAPAASVNVMISGDGPGRGNHFRSQVKTDKNGNFQVQVAPYRFYVIAAKSGRWASPLVSRTVFTTSIESIELKLQKATRVFGRVTIAGTKKAFPNAYVSLYQRLPGRGYLDLPPEQRLPNPNDSRNAISPTIVVRGETNDDGSFEYFVGPGSFFAHGPNNSRQPIFEITNQSVIEINLEAKPILTGNLNGKVVLKSDPTKPVAEAKVFGISFPPMATTAADGTFQSHRPKNDVQFAAFSSDDKLGAIIDVEEGAERVVIEVAPTSTIHGTLIHASSQKPAVDFEIIAGIRRTSEHGTFSHYVQRSTTTDSDGIFTITGIVPGHKYSLNVVRERGPEGRPRSSSQVGQFTASEAETIDVGDMSLPPRR
ncbi:carboxypeptidase-like regulatory domain-containing protein [Planctomycetota bacterium]